jgi:flagellar protein FliS
MTPLKHQKEYISQRVLTASPVELVGILYETALQAVDEALAALHSGDIAARGQSITKAIEVLSELQTSLRREVNPQYCDTLAGLYDYMRQQLLRGHRDKTGRCLQEVARLLQTLLEGWTGAIRNLSAQQYPEQATAAEDFAAAEQFATGVNESNPYLSGAGAGSRGRSWQL